jgi:hypothetical protein
MFCYPLILSTIDNGLLINQQQDSKGNTELRIVFWAVIKRKVSSKAITGAAAGDGW